jgi:putative FmdB family regulatory protein
MPIYEYRCTSCGFQKEFLQKVTDPLFTACPECGKESFRKMLTTAGFQLKGSGWYATDFKNSGAKPASKSKPTDKPDADAKANTATKSESAATTATTSESAASTANNGGRSPA